MAVDHVSVHWVGRLFQPGIYESNDLASEHCDKGYRLPARVRRVLPPLPVASRNRLNRGYRVAFWINLGMIFSAFKERAGDSVRIAWNSGTNFQCYRVRCLAHEKSIAPIIPCLSEARLVKIRRIKGL